VRVGAADEESVTVTVGVALVNKAPPTDDPYTVTVEVFDVVEISMRTLEIGDAEEGEELLTNAVVESKRGVVGHAAAVHLNILVLVVENTISKRSEVVGVEEELLKMMVDVALAPAESSWIRAYTVCTTFAGDAGAAPPRANGMN
jgi:hypothetical protein